MDHHRQHHLSDFGLSYYVQRVQLTDRLNVPSLAIPFMTVVFISCIQFIHYLVVSFNYLRSSISNNALENEEISSPVPTRLGWIKRRIDDLGGTRITLYVSARLLGCLTLFGLSMATLLQSKQPEDYVLTLPPLQEVLLKYSDFLMPITFGYTSLLAVLPLTVRRWSLLATRYNIFLLLVTFGTYAYRDLWPLATYTQKPKDMEEGRLLWFKVAILFVTAVVIPLFIPRRYIPVDPNDPMPVTNDEQTCSLIALALYTYLDPIIAHGARVTHLKFDQLPPLSDTDHAKNLVKNAFPHIDPFSGAKHRHLFFGLMIVFRKEFTTLAFLLLCQAAAMFASPIGVYNILSYLESDGHGSNSDVRPWFWIICMFLGPAVRSTAFQWYIFINTRTLVRAEALITQLVFEHSLRIRIKAEGSDDQKDSVPQQEAPTISDTPDTASIAASSTTGEIADDEASITSGTAVSGEASVKSSQSTTSTVNAKDSKPKENTKKKDENLIGKINNLVTTDLSNIVDSRDFLMLVLHVPLQIILCTVFLYNILGWSAFVGLASLILLYPVPGYIAKRIQDVQRHRIKMTDARVQAITEAVSVIRMIKLFGWEKRMSDRSKEKRDDELAWLIKLRVLETYNGISNYIIPAVSMIATYGTYTAIMKQDLTPSKIFSSVAIFNMLRLQLRRIAWEISYLIQGKVSIERVNDFLQHTELLDDFIESPVSILEVLKPADKSVIGFHDATFAWSLKGNDGALTPSSRNFRLRVNELIFKPNCINLIIGPTGSGKTSMLMALLGEMHFIRNSADSWFHLPREGGVAYAAQESWVQNETIRDNILFGSPYNEARYKKVIYQCALGRDLDLLEAGDRTEVGEKGLTLSGGQKARVTLARAIYSQAQIILLDDVLAALDVHTSAWIVDKCFKGDLVKNRTVLLVTHNLALATPIASFIVTIGLNGSVRAQGIDIDYITQQDPQLAEEARQDREALERSNQEYTVPAEASNAKPTDGKLIVAEEISEGHVTWKSLKLFLVGLGGDYPLMFYSLWLTGFLMSDWVNTFQIWFLGYWGSQYEKHPVSEVNVYYYLGQYTAIFFTMAAVYSASYIFWLYGTMRASKTVNSTLIDSILGSTLRWLDETPTARMIARCTQDIRAVDGPIPQGLLACTDLAISLLTKFGIIIIFTPIFVAPGLAVAALGFYLGNLYLKAQISVKREMSNARSPVLAHFSAAMAGLVSVRAYGAQVPFGKESLKRIDHYIRIARMSYNLNRWIGIRIDYLGALFTAALATYLVYGNRPLGAANTGFSLNMAIDFCTLILWWVRTFNDFEVQANSLERIQHYIDIEHEPKPTEAGIPPASWPTSGNLRVEKLSARYSQTGAMVLHDLSFEIKSGERVGIVGRTGSGKSSLTLALLRCIVTEGTVYYDGIPTSTLNLDALRSNITIIPQTPELLSGTLRRNLDPFEQHDDVTLNNALRDAGLFALQDKLDEARITLDSNIAAGGANVSVGQRQILALARAMVRGSKLLILDEATSAIDYKTDEVIQTTLRHRLASDVTIITVAHRLQTIMDSDKIMVLDAGRIIEFDTPVALLQKEDGLLRGLVEESGEKDVLYSMAEGQTKAMIPGRQ